MRDSTLTRLSRAIVGSEVSAKASTRIARAVYQARYRSRNCEQRVGQERKLEHVNYLGRKDTRNLSFVLWLCLSNQRRMEDKTVFWGVMLRLQRAEQSLFCSQNLDRRSWVLCQVEQ